MQIILDEAFQFGLGGFETIAVEDGKPLFLKEHLDRLEDCLLFLGIRGQRKEDSKRDKDKSFKVVTSGDVETYLDSIRQELLKHAALKIMVSQENTVFTIRQNLYTESVYKAGFSLDYSKVRRNETSPFTFYKTMNYGDCILEKRKAAANSLDDVLFLNSKGEICETTSANIFFVKDGKLYSPHQSCGLLPGIMRALIYQHYSVEDSIIYPKDIPNFQECFLTNSLMGIMPVRKIKDHQYKISIFTEQLIHKWNHLLRE